MHFVFAPFMIACHDYVIFTNLGNGQKSIFARRPNRRDESARWRNGSMI